MVNIIILNIVLNDEYYIKNFKNNLKVEFFKKYWQKVRNG